VNICHYGKHFVEGRVLNTIEESVGSSPLS